MPSANLINRSLTLLTDRIHALPILVLFPHSRCNCRCIMCDIWRGNDQLVEIRTEQVRSNMNEIRKLGVKWVLLSGGEALMHQGIFDICKLFRDEGLRVTVHSTGLLLEKFAAEIVEHCTDLIVSLDGSPPVHDAIRNLPGGFAKLSNGVSAVQSVSSDFPISARCVIQKANFRDLPNIIETARVLRLGQISFLGADVSSQAFNRQDGWNDARSETVTLTQSEVSEFRHILAEVIDANQDSFASGFVAESPEKLTRIVEYYAAVNGQGDFPKVRCNAPWVSSVVEADGTVRPCFFHESLGNINSNTLDEILNSKAAIRFRKQLKVSADPICRRCVCSLNLGPRARV